MKVPLLDLNRQHRKLERELADAFRQVLEHGRFILGPEMELFEKEAAAACGVRHAIACASGSDALLLALMAFDIGPGDEVITTPYSFYASSSCIARVGARAVFADIEMDTYNVDPAEVLKKFTPRTKAIIPVHLYGQSASMKPWLDEARHRGVRVIEDACQAIGAEYEGRPVGTIGDVGCLSFFPTKNLGGLGDGGMLLVGNDALAEKLRVLRVHGMKPKYHHPLLGVNARMDTLQAAMLRVKLPHLGGWAAARRRNADIYTRLMSAAGFAGAEKDGRPVILPSTRQANHVFNQFVIRTRRPESRDPLRKHLDACGVGTEIYYPVPLHVQKCFASWNYKTGDFPKSELAAASTLALPIFPELTEEELGHVVKSVGSFSF